MRPETNPSMRADSIFSWAYSSFFDVLWFSHFARISTINCEKHSEVAERKDEWPAWPEHSRNSPIVNPPKQAASSLKVFQDLCLVDGFRQQHTIFLKVLCKEQAFSCIYQWGKKKISYLQASDLLMADRSVALRVHWDKVNIFDAFSFQASETRE